MADVVSTVVILDSPRRLVIKLLCRSDGTGETDVVKVDKSAYTGLNGREPSSFKIMKILYDVGGMEVKISSDHDTDVALARLSGMGPYCLDYRKSGGISTAGTGGSGDILFTTLNHSSGDSYDITLHLIKKD